MQDGTAALSLAAKYNHPDVVKVLEQGNHASQYYHKEISNLFSNADKYRNLIDDVLNANLGERWYYGSLKQRGVDGIMGH